MFKSSAAVFNATIFDVYDFLKDIKVVALRTTIKEVKGGLNFLPTIYCVIHS